VTYFKAEQRYAVNNYLTYNGLLHMYVGSEFLREYNEKAAADEAVSVAPLAFM
jgi:hypothetical protein